jgi:hypothetical protein
MMGTLTDIWRSQVVELLTSNGGTVEEDVLRGGEDVRNVPPVLSKE